MKYEQFVLNQSMSKLLIHYNDLLAQKQNLVALFNLDSDEENWRQDGGRCQLKSDTGCLDDGMVVV